MTATDRSGEGKRGIDRAGVVIALALAAVAAVLVVDALRIQANVVYGLGPEAMPIVVAIGLGLLAVGNFVNALRGGDAVPEAMDFRPVMLILAGLAMMIAIIGLGGGFIPAMTVLFAATATAFGRRSVITDLVIGFVIGTVIYLAFSKLLTLSLPAGPLEQLF
ncbi:tripartite tricarboxylate transporter TctB family protein [Bradyrhizobium sp. LHD-71]|uniref:tripartite tricarboxylate transporter TctB family protein n=1 Tax=Bradyrhizobium sp. LHD-71 TaxID=3072141 RepID=UPI00280D7E18|nr:tripartite tricarboxylate transporter TctB family protein [Bradyrhizobium sp. LHD-71]MDQ8727069.1 tripartite tricarboxylate transporter TctB family protein [Bradyrhizobium sp. LHD-71]